MRFHNLRSILPLFVLAVVMLNLFSGCAADNTITVPTPAQIKADGKAVVALANDGTVVAQAVATDAKTIKSLK